MKFMLPFLVSLLFWQAAISQQPANERNWMQQLNRREILYKKVAGEDLYLTLLSPTVNKFQKTPVMIFIHGGGWRNGSRQAVFAKTTGESVKQLLQAGIAVATIDYRLVKDGGATIYDCIVDCKDAARYLAKEAERYNLDTARMGVWGSSAGGHLSLMTALGKDDDFTGDGKLKNFSPNFRCVIAYYPLTTFIHTNVQVKPDAQNLKRIQTLFGGSFQDKQALAKLASPVQYVDASNPPILLIHSDKDHTASIKNSTLMKEFADKKQTGLQLLVVRGAGHSFKGENIEPSISEINNAATEFILKHLL